MYNFEGQFRRTPQQNLAGASVKCAREELLRKAQADRLKREYERKTIMNATCIQAYVRGFLIRQNYKRIMREQFDSLETQSVPTFSDSSASVVQHTLNDMAVRLIYFYTNGPEDDRRLVTLMHNLVIYRNFLLESICNGIWMWKLKRLLLFSITNMGKYPDNPNSTYFRSLQLYLSAETYRKILDENSSYLLIIDIHKYLIENGYYKYLRQLVDERIPPVLDTKVVMRNYTAATIANFIDTPIMLTTKTDDPVLRNLVYTNLISSFIYTEYTVAVKTFVLPYLKMSSSFCFKTFVECTFEEYRLHDYHLSSWVLKSLLTLETTDFLLSCDEVTFKKYLDLLSRQSKCFEILHNYYYHQRDLKCDQEDDSDDDDIEQHLEMAVETSEIRVLIESAELMNVWERVDCLVNRFLKIKSADVKQSVIYSLANACFSLIEIKPRALYEFKLLTRLAVVPSFLYDLWLIIMRTERQTQFGTNVRYISLICQGMDLDAEDISSFFPLLTAFCYLFLLFSYTLDDTEFFNWPRGEGNRKPKLPFSMDELLVICDTIKAVCVGMVEMSFPDYKLDIQNRYFPTINEELRIDTKSKRILESSFKAVVSLVQHLYARDLRCQFTPRDMWISDRLHVVSSNVPLSEIDYIINRTINLRPFSGLPSYTKKDLESGPPLTCRQLRTSLIMKHVPFMVSFEDRVMVFQSCVFKDKLTYQGDAPYANRINNVEVNIRRNFIYEDAFEKLSEINEPELRTVLRVTLKTALGTEELGIDGGGVFREFMSELLKTAFDPNRGFFCVTSDNHLYPNPHVELIHPDFVKHYYFIGRMLGKAMYENLLVELPLASFFLSKLTVRHSDLDIHHLASLDPLVYKNLLYLKNYTGDVSDIGLDFTLVNSALGTTKVVELKRGGANIPVTNQNKLAYIYLVADYKLNKQIACQYNAFKEGLTNVIRPEWLHMFSSKDLQILISGAEVPIDINDLKSYTKYSGGFTSEHPTIVIFWKVMEEFDDPTRKLLLKFVTSCSKPPLFGFKDLDPPFCIQNVGDRSRLPTASTCMNLLKMPPYEDCKVLRDRLLYSIRSGAGFELS